MTLADVPVRIVYTHPRAGRVCIIADDVRVEVHRWLGVTQALDEVVDVQSWAFRVALADALKGERP